MSFVWRGGMVRTKVRAAAQDRVAIRIGWRLRIRVAAEDRVATRDSPRTEEQVAKGAGGRVVACRDIVFFGDGDSGSGYGLG